MGFKTFLKSYPKIYVLFTPQYDCTRPFCEEVHMKKENVRFTATRNRFRRFMKGHGRQVLEIAQRDAP